MGTKSSSKNDNSVSTVTNETNNAKSNTDNRVTDSGNIGGNISLDGVTASGAVNISSTDYGAIDAGKEISLAALDFGSDAVESSNNLAKDLFMGAGNLAEQSMDLTGETFGKALDSINQNAKFYAQQTAQNVDRSLAFADASTRSENSDLMSKLFLYGSILAGLFLAGNLMKGMK